MRIALISLYDQHCYGLRHIASFLRQHGHEVWLIVFKQFTSKLATLEQLAAVRRREPGASSPVTQTVEEGTYICCAVEPSTETECRLLGEKLAEICPELIGIAVTTPTIVPAREITAHLKCEFPKTPIIWGGVHPTINPEESLQWTDMICVAEGEHAMVELAQDPERTDLLGVWRRSNGVIVRNPVRPLEQNLDIFPYASWGENEFLIEWNKIIPLLPDNREHWQKTAFIMTQRGCPFSCTYCFNHVRKRQHKGERYVRRRSVDHVLGECEQHVRDFAVTSFPFDDDIFVKDREWLEEFADKYPRRIGLPFGGYGHPSTSDEATVRRLVEAGFVFMIIGIQSGSKYMVQKVYNRWHGFEKIVELARLGEKYGFVLIYELLSNCDYESEADCLDTLRLMNRLPRARQIQVKGLGVFPPMRIATLDLPRHGLSEATFEFWNTLYLLTRYREVPGENLVTLSRDEYLKARPETLRAVALAYKHLDAQILADREECGRLKAREDEVSLRGLLRYGKRLMGHSLPRPIAKWLRQNLRAGVLPRGAQESDLLPNRGRDTKYQKGL